MIQMSRPQQLKYTLLASAVAIACWGMPLSLSGKASDLNRQLAIPINNGTLNAQRRQADQHVSEGQAQVKAGELKAAAESWQAALAIYRQIKDMQAQGEVYEALGDLYADLEMFNESEEAMRRRLGVARAIDDFQGQIFASNALAEMLLRRNKPAEAGKIASDGLLIAKDVQNAKGIGLSLSNMGRAASGIREYDRALDYFERAVQSQREAQDFVGQARSQNYWGDAWRSVRNYKEASGAYQIGLLLAERMKDDVSVDHALEGLALSYEGQGQSGTALRYLSDRLAVAQKAGDGRLELRALRSLASYYRRNQDLMQTEKLYGQGVLVAQRIGAKDEELFLSRQLEDLRLRLSLQRSGQLYQR
jgi:tetratricopeptide (TPR) repeat protein